MTEAGGSNSPNKPQATGKNPAPGKSDDAENQQTSSAQKIIAGKQQAQQEKIKKSVSAKTFLDLDACRDVVGKMFAKEEEKVKEQLANAVYEPPEPTKHVDKFKKATPCASIWENLEGTDKIRFCSLCQLEVYDFYDMDMEEAQDIIWHKVGRRNVPLYKRKDGKFLISDCPIGLAKRNQLICASVGGAAVVAGLLYYLMTLPPPPKPEPVPQAQPTTVKKAPAPASPKLPGAQKQVTLTGGQPPAPAPQAIQAPAPTESEPATPSQGEPEPALPAGLHYADEGK